MSKELAELVDTDWEDRDTHHPEREKAKKEIKEAFEGKDIKKVIEKVRKEESEEVCFSTRLEPHSHPEEYRKPYVPIKVASWEELWEKY